MDYCFSVLMSVYIKEKTENFIQCMESILNQTLLPNEIVLVKDGPISDQLDSAIDKYKMRCKFPIKIVSLKKNYGLGIALAQGVLHCSYGLIARMDTDDICVPWRFERQIQEFKIDKHLDIVGSHIKEFDGTIQNIISERKVPLDNESIYIYQRKRSAFNHMTVMYKKETILKAGNYIHAPFMEDDLMWIHLLQKNAKCKNIDDYFVYVRTGYAMIERRGGWKYFIKYKKARQKIYETGFINKSDYYSTILAQFVVAMVPKQLRIIIFSKIIRKI